MVSATSGSHAAPARWLTDLSALEGASYRTLMTLEVRWINRGPVPDAMIDWLGPFDGPIERRDDRYFIDPGVPDLGIKIRDTLQLDMKAFRGGLGKLHVAGVAKGRLELWEKWSFPLPDGALPWSDDAGWVSLRKTRHRRSFQVDDLGAVERPLDQALLPGCSIELSDVEMGQRRWWTVAVEASGDRETLERDLRATVDLLFREPAPDPKQLDLRHSLSYPRWLQRGERLRRRMPRTNAR